MSSWNTGNMSSTASEAIVEACKEYKELSLKIEKLSARMDVLKDEILSEFPEEAGQQEMRVGNKLTVIVKRAERWTWDADLLDSIFDGSQELPPHVKKRFSVDKRKFQGLDDTQKRELLPALTRKPGPALVEVLED